MSPALILLSFIAAANPLDSNVRPPASTPPPPVFLEDRFDVPAGFRIYKAAGPDLCGGSYDICLDAAGRLLVGDGSQVRRLTDADSDGVYDAQEVIATGLGPRGPQGLCLWGDRLYAVGGDGVQLFEGYLSGKLVHRGRLGERFSTGGDHDAHAVFRGHDGWLYFITGDGGGTKDRKHITEPTSPALFERSSSVFRFSPDGSKWECVASGARNSPNAGMNYLGELFSLDSDMEWHVETPWWRPVRLHHWIQGGDQGWQDVGAYPPYYVDCLPGIDDVGRGSPDWGVFYEHTQLPERYRDAYLVCDYLSKSATTGGYETTGRLFAFFLTRAGAGWKASHEVLVRPKPGAKDENGNPISFALVDIEVAPDGSLLVSDHNQGVWRIIYDPDGKVTSKGPSPIAPAWGSAPDPLAGLLALPQLGSEWARARAASLVAALGDIPEAMERLRTVVVDSKKPTRARLQALRLLGTSLADRPLAWVQAIAKDAAPEIRAQAAATIGLNGASYPLAPLLQLLSDPDPFVRRRACEAATRLASAGALELLLDRLADPDRLVRYAAMVAVSHLPRDSWLEKALARPNTQVRIRALIAADLRREPAPDEVTRKVACELIEASSPGDSKEDRLDLLRIAGRFQRILKADAAAAGGVAKQLLAGFPDPDADIRREQVRLLGEYGVPAAFDSLVTALEREKDPVAQFHTAQAIARIPAGASPGAEERAVRWFLAAQRGWFAELSGKGLQFPHFWLTVLAEFASRHRQALVRRMTELDVSSQLGGVVVDLVAESPDAEARLIALARSQSSPAARRRVLLALARVKGAKTAEFLRDEYLRTADTDTRAAALRALSRQAPSPENLALLEEGLLHPDRDVVRAVVEGLAAYALEPTEKLSGMLLAQYTRRIDLFHPLEGLLARASGRRRPGASADVEAGKRPSDGEIETGFVYWKAWYAEKFGQSFDAQSVTGAFERSDDELRAFIVSEGAKGGRPEAGKKLYVSLRCASCHGGAAEPGKEERIFGPELAGVTRRLNRAELADSLVYPSKQVADRFKGVLVETSAGSILTGFITEKSADAVTLVDQDRVFRIPQAEVVHIEPLESSFMPERLLNRLTLDEVRDLVGFLDVLGAMPERKPETSGDWPGWRGPGGRGVAEGGSPPEHWSMTENVAWRAVLRGWGNSSPAIVGDRLYVTSQADDDTLLVHALDRATGAIVWDRDVGKQRLESHELHNMATPTPAADAEAVWALFGTGDLACLSRSGEFLWRRNLARDHGEYKILHGMGSSPVLHGGLLYTVCMHSGPSYVLALDKLTGKDVWKQERSPPCQDEAVDSYSSPVFVEVSGRVEMLVGGCDHVNAYDPLAGKQLWISSGLKINHAWGRTMASPGAGDGIAVACSSSVQGLGKLIAIRAGGEGDVTESRRLWQYDKFTPDCPSPLVHDGHVYVVRDDGIASCLDAKSGELRWRKRLAHGGFKASPVAAAGRVYFLSEGGDCVVVKAGPAEVIIAENHLDGHFIATPAIKGGQLYFRTKDKVIAVGQK